MGGTIWFALGAIVLGLLAIWARAVLFARQTNAARNGRVSREFLYVLVMLVLFAELLLLPGALDSRLVEVALGVFWFGFLALWLAAIILFARKTTGARNARVAREALLVWLVLFAVSVIISVPGGMEACLTTAARLFVGETAARRVGKTGFFAVMYAAGAVLWFHLIRCGYVLRPAFLLPLKTEPKEIQRRVDALWDKPPKDKARLAWAVALAVLFVAIGLGSAWGWSTQLAESDDYLRRRHEERFREYAQEGWAGPMAPLIEDDVDVNAADAMGNTALHWAALAGQGRVVEFLLAEGAEVNLCNWNGKTPLRLALDKGHDEIARLLREHGGIE